MIKTAKPHSRRVRDRQRNLDRSCRLEFGRVDADRHIVVEQVNDVAILVGLAKRVDANLIQLRRMIGADYGQRAACQFGNPTRERRLAGGRAVA